MRFHIVMLKTLKDLFSIKRSLVFLIISLIPVFIFANVSQREAVFNFKVMTLPMQIQMMNGIFIIMSFIWIAGIPLVLLAAMTCGSFISKEEQDGTLLLLASKPIRRYEIIIGKFFAFLVSTMILELIAFLLAPLLTFNLLDLDPSALTSMLNMVPSLYLYSLFVTFVFGAISATLSVLSRNRVKVVMVLVALTILIYFGFSIIRGWTVPLGVYDKYGMNYFDVNYQLGNSYVFFLEQSGVKIMPPIQGILGQFTGVYEATDPEMVFDPDLGAMPSSLELKKYNTPLVSLSIWLGLAVFLLVTGILKFEKKEIY